MYLELGDVVTYNDGERLAQGDVVAIYPFGCEIIDPDWKDWIIQIKDFLTGELFNCDPRFVIRDWDGYCPCDLDTFQPFLETYYG